MNFLIVIVLVIVVAVILAILKSKQPSRDAGLSFDSKSTLFSPAERSFLGVLEQVLDNRYRVFGKVRLWTTNAYKVAIDGSVDNPSQYVGQLVTEPYGAEIENIRERF